ncbi:hypothetical protein ACGF1Z_07540 [Streptomyces sp. NPDC048018]|uniref:hypothetical protein n=1 Tax=Streptomyces sp. NPDC048018 TaxID=3365499 RepID=UPI00371478B7
MAEQQDGEREPQPIDEAAAWAAIVAGYGEEPADPPGARPFRPVEDLALPEMPEEDGAVASATRTAPEAPGTPDTPDAQGTPGTQGTAGAADTPAAADKPDKFRKPEAPGEPDRPALGSSVVFAPGVGLGGGPRDYAPPEPDESAGTGDEGHFVPPEPPPLPEADTTTRFAWLAVVGGPVLMLLAVLLQWDMTWWLTTVCVGGFLGGFVTLVARMKHDDEDDDGFDDPGRGAVV